MKQKYFYLLTLLLLSFLGIGQTTTLPYNDDIYTNGFPSVTLNNFSTCQVGASITSASQRWTGSSWVDSNYSIIVNGSNIGSYSGGQTIDITSYMPITSVQMSGSYSSWSWVDLTVNITSNDSSMPASGPTVNNVTYVQGDTASPLTATLTSTGTTFKWYTDEFGDNYTATGPTPSTATIGTTSYWVAQADSGGCESVRSEIIVTVVANTPATHLNFDGTNDFVDLGNTLTSTLNGSNFLTAEAWVYTPSATGTKTIVGNHISNGAHFNLRIINDRLNGFLGFGAYDLNSAPGTIVANTWQHVAMVYNDTTLKLYIDGTEVASMAIPASYSLQNTIQPYRIGASGYGGEYFNGNIDDVRIWNIVKTPEQLSASKNCELQGTESGLLAYYKFNQGVAEANNTAITTLTATTGPNGTLNNFNLNGGATSNWLAGSPVTTGSVIPGNPTISTPVIYTVGDTASALTATTGTNGSGLSWYTSATGGTGSTTAPTPSTAAAGSTSYWVASTNANGCESERIEIVVTVYAAATHLNFDGTNDRITGTNSNLPQGNSPRTIEAWVKNSTGNDMTIFNYGNVNAVNNQVFTLHLYDGIYIIGLNNDINTGFNINDGNWHHVAVSHDGTNTRIYVDGNLINTTAKTFNTTGNDFQIGTTFRNGSYIFNLNGSLDDIRVWNVARTAEQIAGSMNCELNGSENGLIAYYQFNQGTDQADNSGITTLNATTGPNGTLTNFTLNGATSNWLAGSPVTTGSVIPGNASATSPINYNQGDSASALTATTGTNGSGLMWYTSATGGTGSTTAPTPSTATAGSTSYWVASSNANGCESERIEIVVNVTAYATHLNFDGANDIVNTGNGLTTYFTGKTAVTVEAWVRPETNSGLGVIAGNYDYPSSGLGLQMLLRRDNNGYSFWIDGGTGYSNVVASNTVVLNTWQHVAGVWDGATMKIYVDGTLINTVAKTGIIPSKTSAFVIGGNAQTVPEMFNGDIDEVRIWDIALTQTDIQVTKDCELQASQTGIVAYYKFNQGFDNTNNAPVTTLTDELGNYNGTLNNFALTGAMSNWAAGSPVTTGNTCATLSNSDFDSVAGKTLKIYPNPTTGVFSIRSNVNLTIEIYDLLGKTILTKKINSGIEDINITNYPSGIYLVKSTNEEGNSKMYKIIKK